MNLLCDSQVDSEHVKKYRIDEVEISVCFLDEGSPEPLRSVLDSLSNAFERRVGLIEDDRKEVIMKRVLCLYRVSTSKQVDEDGELSMQRNACHEFVSRQRDWQVVRESTERGISGFKIEFDRRDGIQQIKDAVNNHEIDVVLAYMLDRIGRRADERTQLFRWLIEQGIEIWSVTEGQQKLENIGDKVTNLIRSEEAENESRKTSLRVSEAKRQLTEMGRYTGGPVPFGYMLVDSGKISKKGYPLKEMAIDPRETPFVRMIFDYTINLGYGSHRLACLLNDMGVRTHGDRPFTASGIRRVLKNRIYTGFIVSGGVVSNNRRNDLVLVDDFSFDEVQEILRQRDNSKEIKTNIARTTKAKTLLSGNIYCAHCGSKLNATSFIDKFYSLTSDKANHRRQQYICTGKRKDHYCDGQWAYNADRIDNAVADIIRQYLSQIKTTPKDRAIETRYQKQIAEQKVARKQLLGELDKKQAQLKELSTEVAKSIVGDSQFTPEVLSMSIDHVKEEIKRLQNEYQRVDASLNNQETAFNKLDYLYSRFTNWADEFDAASTEQKKMIICQLVKEIRIGRGYQVELVFNFEYQQFLEHLQDGSQNQVQRLA